MVDGHESGTLTCPEQPDAAVVVKCSSRSRPFQLNSFSLSHSTATEGCQGREQKRELIRLPAGRSLHDLAVFDLRDNKPVISCATIDRLKWMSEVS